jgi:hypothetical protein
MGEEEVFDSPEVDNCTDEMEGEACDQDGARCDGVFGCGATLVCAASDPTQGPGGCPISRASRKRDIRYLSDAARRKYAAELNAIELAEYYYKDAPEGPLELGFIIDDVEPSVAVRGDRVNLYGALSMAIATVQLQKRELEALNARVAELEARLLGDTPMCREPSVEPLALPHRAPQK